jgi:hypothetical protein
MEEERIKSILTSLGIQMRVEGCGCCGSPTVTFIYNNEVIVRDEDHFEFNNVEPEPPIQDILEQLNI